jgi:hypothetical protein
MTNSPEISLSEVQLAAITKAKNLLWISPGRMEPGGLIGAPGRLALLLSLLGLR